MNAGAARARWMALALLLASCATHSTGPVADKVQVAPTLTLVMPHPGDLGRSFEVSQLVTAHYGDQAYVFEGHLSAKPDRFLMIGLDTTGRRALTITWTDSGIVYEAAPWVPARLRPENILADMVLLYFPDRVVGKALAASGGTVTTSPSQRVIKADGKEAITADYQPTVSGDPWSGRQHYRNLAWGYELDIQTAEPSP
ncbi:DUF3261 domain-containing protein [Hypericibacter terrae]|nr:DUF3261 domain-containing protein [Hypericibacter terrae]